MHDEDTGLELAGGVVCDPRHDGSNGAVRDCQPGRWHRRVIWCEHEIVQMGAGVLLHTSAMADTALREATIGYFM
jgi:hypothetical protein